MHTMYLPLHFHMDGLVARLGGGLARLERAAGDDQLCDH